MRNAGGAYVKVRDALLGRVASEPCRAPIATATELRFPLTFNGRLPDPALSGIYRYTDVFEKPFTGPPPKDRAAEVDDFELAAPMARWLSENDHRRPFFRDRAFIAEFGRLSKSDAVAAVNALWARADRAATAAGTPITLPARLGSNHKIERN